MCSATRPFELQERSAMIRHFVDLFELEPACARDLLDRAAALKRDEQRGQRPLYLSGRTLGLIFEKPSLRTRVSFEAAIAQLGGGAIFLRDKDVGMGSRESIADFARVISQYVDALAVRTFAHATIEELARHATVPIINALSDLAHPCQALADMLTIQEALGTLAGVKLVFVGDGNNVARSLALAAALLGVQFVLAAPLGYEFPVDFRARFQAVFPGHPLAVVHDPHAAVQGADVVYTDVWASMGQEHEADARRAVFAPFQVNARLMAGLGPEAVFLHCLPAHRGEEVTSEVLDGPQSRIIPQAANRLHFQKALLIWLILERWPEELEGEAGSKLQRTIS
jgi:ornithine carbamoyltransferase